MFDGEISNNVLDLITLKDNELLFLSLADGHLKFAKHYSKFWLQFSSWGNRYKRACITRSLGSHFSSGNIVLDLACCPLILVGLRRELAVLSLLLIFYV